MFEKIGAALSFTANAYNKVFHPGKAWASKMRAVLDGTPDYEVVQKMLASADYRDPHVLSLCEQIVIRPSNKHDPKVLDMLLSHCPDFTVPYPSVLIKTSLETTLLISAALYASPKTFSQMLCKSPNLFVSCGSRNIVNALFQEGFLFDEKIEIFIDHLLTSDIGVGLSHLNSQYKSQRWPLAHFLAKFGDSALYEKWGDGTNWREEWLDFSIGDKQPDPFPNTCLTLSLRSGKHLISSSIFERVVQNSFDALSREPVFELILKHCDPVISYGEESLVRKLYDWLPVGYFDSADLDPLMSAANNPLLSPDFVCDSFIGSRERDEEERRMILIRSLDASPVLAMALIEKGFDPFLASGSATSPFFCFIDDQFSFDNVEHVSLLRWFISTYPLNTECRRGSSSSPLTMERAIVEFLDYTRYDKANFTEHASVEAMLHAKKEKDCLDLEAQPFGDSVPPPSRRRL